MKNVVTLKKENTNLKFTDDNFGSCYSSSV